jgi:hypothetical protein
MQDATRDTSDQDLWFAPCPVFYPARHIHNQALTQFDFRFVQLHPTMAIEYIIDLIGVLVIVECGVGDFQVMLLEKSMKGNSEWRTQQEVVTLAKAIAAQNQEAYHLFADKLLEVEPSFAKLIPQPVAR